MSKTVLITGGAGFFGQRCAEIILKEYHPKAVRIYDNREFGIVEMQRKFKDKRLRFLIGDVRDKNRLDKAMKDVDIVIHAAALKHVPICEYNPEEAVKTNIDGARNVIDCAKDNNVDKVMMISTDKAVHPVNLYGATKMVSEKLFIQGNIGGNTKFSCSRYGNVLGSRGSVIPLFKQQKGTEITITDERMTRFWISLDDGINFVLNSIKEMKGGEIFIPKIPSMKIIDLANAIAPNTPKKIIGMKPGEKLNEMLISEEETYHAKEFEKYFVIEPQFSFWGDDIGGNSFGDRSGYTSDNNKRWITEEEIKQTLI